MERVEITELVVKADGALAVLGQYETGMERAGQATQKAGVATEDFQKRIDEANAKLERGLAISTQRLDRMTADQRAIEKWQSRMDPAVRMEIKLRREARAAAVDYTNAVLLGHMTQADALRDLAKLDQQLNMQLHETVTASRAAAQAQSGLASSVDATTGAMLRQNAAANDNAAGFRRRNLGYQLFDVGQGLALGMNPGMIAMQQGPQIAQIYAGQGGVNTALKDTGALLGGVARAFGPVAVAAGVAALAIKGVQNEINSTSGVTVSYKNVAVAVFQAIGDVISDALKPAIDAIAPWFTAAWNAVLGGLKWITNLLINLWRAAFENLRFVFTQFPNIVAVAVGGAANLVVTGIEKMINKVTAGMDKLSGKINEWLAKLPDWLKPEGGLEIPMIGNVRLGRVNLGGTDEDLARAWKQRGANIDAIMASDPMGSLFDRIRQHSVENALADQADSKKGGRRGKTDAEKAADNYADLVRGAEQYIASQKLEQQALFMTAEAAAALRFEQDLLNKAANDNISLLPAQKQELHDLAAAMAASQAETKRMNDAIDFGKDIVKGFLGTLRSGLEQGKSLWESFGDAVLNVLEAVTDRDDDAALDGIIYGEAA